nr:hypothetical protein [Tanacetum cinerariifolium]
METQVDLGDELQGRKYDDNASSKDVNAAEPTIFDNEEMAKRLHDEEVEQAAAREKQETDDLEKDKGLQQQYDDVGLYFLLILIIFLLLAFGVDAAEKIKGKH